MQKLSLLPLLLITGIGAVWASTLMFPNTTEFPRSPGGAGTISGALAFFDPSNGTATNTEKLNGVTASGYLKNKDCSLDMANPVWVGVDATGKAICGTRTTLLAIGTITEKGGSFTIWRGGSPIASPVGTTVREGDTIITDPTGTGTIAFIADESILRLDTSTVVELSIGQLSGQSVAQAILSDGRLWGRILTSTGVNLGGGGMVAGVRGTSVSVERVVATNQYTIAVIDSIRPLDAATLSAIDGISLAGASLTPLHAGSQISVYAPTSPAGTNNTSYVTSSSPSTTKTTLLDGSPWIRDNTRADIDYLYTNSGVTPRVLAEYNATISLTTPATILDALCPTLSGQNLIYWRSLIGTSYEKCQDSILMAFADYTRPGVSGAGIISPASLYTSGSTINPIGGGGTWSTAGYSIINPGDKILYPIQGLGLAGKKITITVDSLPSNNNGILVDFGGTRVSRFGTGYKCLWNSSTSCVTVDEFNKTLTFVAPSTTLTGFMIGNNISPINFTPELRLPIGVAIKGIKISN